MSEPIVQAITNQDSDPVATVSEFVTTVGFSADFNPLFREFIVTVGVEVG